MPAAKNIHKTTSPDVVCPLFADVEPPIYAKDILKIRISRIEKSSPGIVGGKIPLTKEDYYIDGDEDNPFEIDPYETTEEDLQEQFGAGVYWVDALQKGTGKTLHGGHRVILGGIEKRGGLPVDDDDETDDEEESSGKQKKKREASVMTLMEKLVQDRERNAREMVEREREYAAKQADMHGTFASTMFKIASEREKTDPSMNEMVSSYRRQLDAALDKSARDLDDLRKSHRDELTRRDREMEDMRREHREELNDERKRARSDLERREQEINDLRSRFQREEEDLRRRFQKDLDEQRSRYERELSQAAKDVAEVRSNLSKENDRMRQQLEKRISELERDLHQLEKDNIALEKDLAKAQNAAREPADPPAAAGMVEQFVPVLQQIVAGAARKMMESSQPNAPAQPPAYLPPEAYAPQGYPQPSYPTGYDSATQAPMPAPGYPPGVHPHQPSVPPGFPQPPENSEPEPPEPDDPPAESDSTSNTA